MKQNIIEKVEALNLAHEAGTITGKVELTVYDENGDITDLGSEFNEAWGAEAGEERMNQTLNMAKTVFSRLASGDVNYKIAKIAFGNAGHDFANPKIAVPPTVADMQLLSLERIKTSLNDADTTKHFLYEDGSAVNHRMIYIEKDILPEHISFGPNGNQLIINIPISYEEFNSRTGGATTTDVAYVDSLLQYKTVNPADDTIIEFDGVIADGTPIAGFTEVHSVDDNGTMRYTFKNGVTNAGAIDVVNGGDRPQELSEIGLSTDIVGAGTVESPYKKLSTSRITSGLLSFPENFSFTY
ncbi:hypothetical protein JHD46_08300, partial [Sulfurimonas sp. SAG-AH-194-C20]